MARSLPSKSVPVLSCPEKQTSSCPPPSQAQSSPHMHTHTPLLGFHHRARANSTLFPPPNRPSSVLNQRCNTTKIPSRRKHGTWKRTRKKNKIRERRKRFALQKCRMLIKKIGMRIVWLGSRLQRSRPRMQGGRRPLLYMMMAGTSTLALMVLCGRILPPLT